MTLEAAQTVVEQLTLAGQTVATAESLTGGLVCAALVDVPGASQVVRGAVVAYQPDVKVDAVGVDPLLIEQFGTVDHRVAEQLADGVRVRLGADWGIGTTGVAGPGPNEGKRAGTVFVAVAGPDGVQSRELSIDADRAEVRSLAVREVLTDLQYRLGKNFDPTNVESDKEGDGDDRDA